MGPLILADSSAWIEYLRGTGSETHLQLRELVTDGARVATTDLVLLEVLAGAQTQDSTTRWQGLLYMCEYLRSQPPLDYEAGAAIYRTCRRGGETIRALERLRDRGGRDALQGGGPVEGSRLRGDRRGTSSWSWPERAGSGCGRAGGGRCHNGDVESLKGKLLLASPTLEDPNFVRTVVLVAEHTDEGAMGLVLNRPADVTVGESAPELEELVDARRADLRRRPGAADRGDRARRLHRPGRRRADDQRRRRLPVRAARPRRVGGGHTPHARVRWPRRLGPGQLDEEMEREDWIVETPRPDELFASDPEALWSRVLTRKGGTFALVARMPLDPSLN